MNEEKFENVFVKKKQNLFILVGTLKKTKQNIVWYMDFYIKFINVKKR